MKEKKRIYLGFLVSLLFLYFAFKNVRYHEVWLHIQEINLYFVMVSVVFMIAQLLLRAIRWKYLLRPIKEGEYAGLFSVLMIGYFGNNILPARMGELVRAQFLGTNYNFSRMQALATIVVERIFDGLMVVGLFGFSLLFYHRFPLWMKQGGLVMAVVFLGTLVILYIYGRKRDSIVGLLRAHTNASPFSERLLRMMENFGIGLTILNDGRNIIVAVPLTVLIWVFEIVSINMVLLAFGLKLSFFAGVFIAVMIGLGTMIPASPGYMGVYEWFGMLALVPFGVAKDLALAFSLTLHLVVLAVTSSIGFVCFIKEFGSLREGAVRLWPIRAE